MRYHVHPVLPYDSRPRSQGDRLGRGNSGEKGRNSGALRGSKRQIRGMTVLGQYLSGLDVRLRCSFPFSLERLSLRTQIFISRKKKPRKCH